MSRSEGRKCLNCGYPDQNSDHHDCCPDGHQHKFEYDAQWAPNLQESKVITAPTSISDGTGKTPTTPLAAKIASVPRKRDNDDPLWRGPCSAGPLGGITQSMIVRFLSCRERFRLRYVCGLEPHDKWTPGLGYGNMWHACEEGHAKDGNWQPKAITHFNEQLRLYPLQREEIVKWFNVCCVQFPEYVKYWATHPDVLNRAPLMQEQVFDVPYSLPSGRTVRLRGKFDSVDLIDGGIYLQENKTKGDVDRSRIEQQLKFDLQTMMYLIALTESAKTVPILNLNLPGWKCIDNPLVTKDELNGVFGGRPVLGVRYNVVKRDCPIKQHVGRQLKAGWKDGETTEHWMERLRTEYYGAAPEEYFLRIRSEVSAKDIEVFRRICLDPLLEHICVWYEATTNEEFYRQRKHCDPVPMNYRTPFGVYSALEEGGATEYDAYMETGSEMGLVRTEKLFTELQ